MKEYKNLRLAGLAASHISVPEVSVQSKGLGVNFNPQVPTMWTGVLNEAKT